MNAQLKTILLTILTLSVFTIAIVELTGVSKTAFINKYTGGGEEDRIKQVQAMPKTEMQFNDTKYSFRKIKEGEVVRHAFHFKNVGSAPLLISKAEASCGCTVPSFPKEPIPPGGEGDITIQFDSHNRKGHQIKNVLIHSNSTLEKMSIGFDADVE